MSQESNTGSSSSDSEKRKLVLRKKGKGTPSPAAPAAGAPAEGQPAEEARKPIRMSFKRAEEPKEETAPEPADTPEPISPPRPSVPEAPAEPEKPKKKLGLKRGGTSPAEPAPAPTISPTPSPDATAEPEDTKPKLGLKRSGGAQPEEAPPGQPRGDMNWGLSHEEQDGETIPEGTEVPAAEGPEPIAPPPPVPETEAPPPPAAAMPPPPTGTTPPPLPSAAGAPPPPPVAGMPPPPPRGTPPPAPGQAVTAPDLVSEALDQKKKPNHLKGILIGVAIMLILLGGIAAVGFGLLGAMGGDDGEAASVPDTPNASAEASTDSEKNVGTELAHLPKSLIDKAQNTVDQVNEKASIDHIVGDTTPAPVAPGSAPESPRVDAAAPADNGYLGQDPAVLKWVETMGPVSFGRGKMLYNGQVYTQGDIINQELQVRWTGHDQPLGLLIFEDASGTIYEKDY